MPEGGSCQDDVTTACATIGHMEEAETVASDRTDVPDAGGTVNLTAVAKALSDPIRLEMLRMLACGRNCCALPDPSSRGVPGDDEPRGMCVCEFQDRFGLAQSRVSYHVRVLREAGLIRSEERGRWTFHELDREAAAAALRAFRDLLEV
jgi:ArsR family transcriptional regulator, arsenate/arsenite/antimonite-responsive transcriptional repressor